MLFSYILIFKDGDLHALRKRINAMEFNRKIIIHLIIKNYKTNNGIMFI